MRESLLHAFDMVHADHLFKFVMTTLSADVPISITLLRETLIAQGAAIGPYFEVRAEMTMQSLLLLEHLSAEVAA